MRKILPPALLLFLLPAFARADGWSIGAGTGPFAFGYFLQRTTAIGNGAGSGVTRSRLSANTRPGGFADLERDFNDWLGLRLDAAWTRAPMRIKSLGGSGVTFDAGHANILTFALPV